MANEVGFFVIFFSLCEDKYSECSLEGVLVAEVPPTE